MPEDWREKLAEDAALARLKALQTRAVPPPPKAIGNAMRRALAPLLKEAGPAPGTLAARWSEIVGPKLAGVTEPLRVAPARGGAVLHIRASPAAAGMIQHAGDHIRQRVELATGTPIKSLKITQTAADAPKPRKALPQITPEERARITADLADVPSPRVRAALSQLGESIALSSRPPAPRAGRKPPPAAGE